MRALSVAAQKLFNFNALRSGQTAAMAGAFQSCGSRGESQRVPEGPAFGEPEREGAMEDVACAKGIHGRDRKRRRLLQRIGLAQPDRAARAAGCGGEGGRLAEPVADKGDGDRQRLFPDGGRGVDGAEGALIPPRGVPRGFTVPVACGVFGSI